MKEARSRLLFFQINNRCVAGREVEIKGVLLNYKVDRPALVDRVVY